MSTKFTECPTCGTRWTGGLPEHKDICPNHVNHPTCLDSYRDECSGTVEFRMPLSGTGKSFPRCDKHWDERLDVQAGINERYPDSPFAPADFDPTYAGESWDGE